MAKKVKKKAVTKKAVTKKSASKKKATSKKATHKKRTAPTKQRLKTVRRGGADGARVDAYIEQAAEFAQPILSRLRDLFHEGCPAIEEKIKWGAPHFDHKGMMGGMAAFRNHVSFGFWKADQIRDTHKLFDRGPKASMCTVKITSLDAMPADDIILDYVRQAAALNDAGTKKTKSRKPPREALPTPTDLAALLGKNRKAKATFDAFPPSHRREYIEWITEAKRDETRQKRLAQTMEWLAEGKSRNWKYMRK
ncbi:MAG TPA: YdeI/OmpD-associated family protein [Phycisphaerae bacterium]|nr:YdeI/OmpD-associated family protein [Phycisphaerae bacterium]